MKFLMIFLTISCFECRTNALTQAEMVGEFEGKIVFPTAKSIHMENYIMHLQLNGDGTVLYKEFYNNERTKGILGIPSSPACSGNWSMAYPNTVMTYIDCSAQSEAYQAEFHFGNYPLANIQSPRGVVINVKSTARPGRVFRFAFRKMMNSTFTLP